MKEENLIAALVSLVEGKTAPQTWVKWWQDNASYLEKLLPRTAFLKIKPNATFGETRATLISQTGAHTYLQKIGIELDRSDVYSKEWLVDFQREAVIGKGANAAARNAFSSDFTILERNFPKLFSSLQSHLLSQDTIVQGKAIAEIEVKEVALQLPDLVDLNLFFKSVSILEVDGIKYNFADIRQMQVGDNKYLFWGEYWLENDGDSVLIDYDGIVYYLNHSQKLMQPRQLANDFRIFIEKELANFINESNG